MTGPAVEKVKRGGFTFQVWQTAGGWHAGAEGSRGGSREAAITNHLAYSRRERRKTDAASKLAGKAADAKLAKRAGRECTLTYCSSAIDSPAHRQSAKHRNAEAVDRHRRYG